MIDVKLTEIGLDMNIFACLMHVVYMNTYKYNLRVHTPKKTKPVVAASIWQGAWASAKAC